MSVMRGTPGNLYFRADLAFRAVKFKEELESYAVINVCTMCDMASA